MTNPSVSSITSPQADDVASADNDQLQAWAERVALETLELKVSLRNARATFTQIVVELDRRGLL